MEPTVESLEEQALALPVKDRLRLANTMLKSADGEEEITEKEWEVEMKRRIDAIKTGDHSGVTFEEFEQRFEECYKK